MTDAAAVPANDDDAKYVERLENIDREVEKIMEAAREECAEFKTDRQQVLKDAKDAGHSTKVINAAVKERKAKRKIDRDRARLGQSDQDRLDMILHALGDLKDTPLGAAAVKAAA
jgi:uncharacterized protein (UPF0335 family)